MPTTPSGSDGSCLSQDAVRLFVVPLLGILIWLANACKSISSTSQGRHKAFTSTRPTETNRTSSGHQVIQSSLNRMMENTDDAEHNESTAGKQ